MLNKQENFKLCISFWKITYVCAYVCVYMCIGQEPQITSHQGKLADEKFIDMFTMKRMVNVQLNSRGTNVENHMK